MMDAPRIDVGGCAVSILLAAVVWSAVGAVVWWLL